MPPSVTVPWPERSNQSFQTPPSLVQSASVSGSCTAASRSSPYRLVTFQLAIGVMAAVSIRQIVLACGSHSSPSIVGWFSQASTKPPPL